LKCSLWLKSIRGLGELVGKSEQAVRKARRKAGVHPVYKRVDTCAAEFKAKTPYMYSTYEMPSFGSANSAGEVACEAGVSDRKKVIILGGGPNRIGQGIEFDYCCCHAASDRLYFEPLSEEDVLELVRKEMSSGELLGVIVQFGGQTPLKLAEALEDNGIPLLGTKRDALDRAEDRERFKALVDKLGLKQPNNDIVRTAKEAEIAAEKVGYPVVLRPSNVLGGRGMEIVEDTPDLRRYVNEAVKVSGKSPLLIDQYLRDAIEVDVDVICDGEDVFIVIGLMNVQFAVKDGIVYLIEVNPRASRTVPFVAKAIGLPVASLAAKVMSGMKIKDLDFSVKGQDYIAVKEAVFPFARFPGVDTVLGPEMRSTGEVMGFAPDFGTAFAKSQLGGGVNLPTTGKVFISVREQHKPVMADLARELILEGFAIIATGGTTKYLREQGIECEYVRKVHEGRPHIVDQMKNGDIALVFNTTSGKQSLKDSFSLRRTALTQKIPYFTTAAAARASVEAIKAIRKGGYDVKSLQAIAAS